MKRRTIQFVFVALLVLLVFGFLEIALLLLTFVSPQIDRLVGSPWAVASIRDERLGYRPAPIHPEHDRNGFRNPAVPTEAHVVALGDSQTYGTGVVPEDTWPRQLVALTGRPVYNMAFGGYGPTHSLMMWDEATAFLPEVVIEAFYVGNDLFDAFNHIYNQEQLPELKSTDLQLQERVREKEQLEPIVERVARIVRVQGKRVGPDGTEAALTFRRFLARYSKLYGLLRRARYEMARLAGKPNNILQENWGMVTALAEAYPNYFQVYNDGQFKTVFTSEYRLVALDFEDPRIAEGLRISLAAIARMQERAVAEDVRFLVVLIPTKENVWSQLWQDPSESYRRLIETEERVWRTVKTFLDDHGVQYLDSLPMLQEQLAAGIQPYQISADGHPNKFGHEAIAKLVADHLATPEAKPPAEP